MGLRFGFGLENKDQKKIKGTTKPLMANLDITVCIWTLFIAFCSIHSDYIPHVASENHLTKIGKVTAAFHHDSSRASAAECQSQYSAVVKAHLILILIFL